MDHDLYIYLAIALLTLCSLITRTSFILFGDYIPLPEGVRRALRYAPIAALFAIIVPDLLPWVPGEGPTFNLRLPAGVIAILLFVRTRSSVLIIVGGMVALWILRWLF